LAFRRCTCAAPWHVMDFATSWAQLMKSAQQRE
jgi:hypothetical protein